jgi:hypothetical protein
MAAPNTSLRPKARPRTKTKEKTLRGRPVWIDNTGEVTGEKGAKYSEVTTTIPWGTEWITAPSIDENGERLSDDEVKERLLETRGKDFITGEELPIFSNPEKASEYAQWRSDTMFDQEAIEQGFPEEFPMEPEPERKDFIDRGIDKGKDFLEYLTTPSKHGVFNKGGDVIGPKSELERQREVNIAEQMATLPKKKDEYKPPVDPQKEEIIKKYNLDGARSGWKVGPTAFHTIYENLPTNFRLLTEFILGKDTPITMSDFTKDELVSMIALSENQEENKLNLKNRKLKGQPENVTTVTTYKLKPTDRYPDWVESNPYFRAMAHSLFSPEYQVRTTLGRYDTEDTPSSLIVKDAYDMNIRQRSLPKLSNRKDLAEVLDYMRIDPEMAGEFIANIFRPNPQDSRKIDLVIPKRKKVENFNEGGDVSTQMQSLMIPSADDDIRPEDYVQYRKDNFTAASFAEDSWEDTKKRFMDAGRIDVNPEDPAVFTAYKRAVDYLKDTGLAGLGLADTAFKYAVGSVAQVMPTEALEKRMARDLYSMPEAFAGAAGAKSLTQLDDAADAFLEGSLQVARKAGQIKPDPNTLASFAGAVPPTYIQRDTPLSEMGEYQLDYFRQVEPTEKTKLKDLAYLNFREPISEFIETLTIPKKGMLGSEFLNQIKKNSSIPETSLQEGIIDPSKRYTKDELFRAIGAKHVEGKKYSTELGAFKTRANISPYKIKEYEDYQRQQKHAGFQGGNEVEYFDIPVDSQIRSDSSGFGGKPFKGNRQHYNQETLVHVRGSIIDPSGYGPAYSRDPQEFDYIINDKNYLLAEEIQSDLLTKGYAKPNNFFDAVFSEATKNWAASNLITYQEAYGDIDKEIKKILKLLDDPSSAHLSPGRVSSNPKFYNFSSSNKVNFEDRKRGLEGLVSLDRIDYDELSDLLIKTSATEKDIDQVFETLKADALLEPILLRKSAIDSMWENDPEAAVFLERGLDDITDVDFLDSEELLKLPEVNSILDEGIKEDFLNYHNKRQQALDSATEEYLNFLQSQIDKLKINDTIDAKDLAELHENMIMAQSYTPDTSDIGLPPIRKNKQAVDEALKVLIAKAAQSGVDKIVIPPAEKIAEARGRVLKKDKGDRFYRTYVTDLNKSLEELEANYPVTIYKDVELPYKSKIFKPEGTNKRVFNVVSKGTIIDISELVNRFKVEQPRQFAQGGVAMNEQMEMAFMQQGGLKDDGMNQDPISGNEVPSGSLASEVRDDIPAQLSEGEYVVPADVVRYFGVKHFEDLRNKAKGGLNKMEADGRIGGEPVPVGGPKADLRPDEMQEIQKMFEGGMVAGAANGGDFSFYNPTSSTTEEVVTTPTRYSGEFSFEQPGAGLATPPPEVTIPETPEQKAVTLYGPNGEIANLMLPKDQQKYDQLVSQGYGISAPQVVQQQDDTTSKRVLEEIKTSESSKSWMDDYSYQDSDKLLTESLNALEPTKGFGKIFEGGAMGQLMKASNAAQVAANLRVLRSQGVSEIQLQPLQDKLDKYVSDNAFGDLLPDSWYDGSELYKDLQGVYGEDFTKQVVKPQGKYSPTATTEAKGFTKNILSQDEQKIFDNAVDKGDTALVNHFVGINRLRNKKDAYAEILETQGEAAASAYAQATNMGYYDIEDAKTYGGSQQTAINQGRAEPGGFLRDAKLIDRMKTGTNKAYTVPETKTIMQDAAKDTVREPTLLKPTYDPSTRETTVDVVGGGRVYKPGGIDVALTPPPNKEKKKSEPSFHDQYTAAVKKSREKSEASRQAMQRAQDKGGSSKDVADLKKKFEDEGGTWASGGRARGGLMKKKKSKK